MNMPKEAPQRGVEIDTGGLDKDEVTFDPSRPDRDIPESPERL